VRVHEDPLAAELVVRAQLLELRAAVAVDVRGAANAGVATVVEMLFAGFGSRIGVPTTSVAVFGASPHTPKVADTFTVSVDNGRSTNVHCKVTPPVIMQPGWSTELNVTPGGAMSRTCVLSVNVGSGFDASITYVSMLPVGCTYCGPVFTIPASTKHNTSVVAAAALFAGFGSIGVTTTTAAVLTTATQPVNVASTLIVADDSGAM
jgi:hypothetical protein